MHRTPQQCVCVCASHTAQSFHQSDASQSRTHHQTLHPVTKNLSSSTACVHSAALQALHSCGCKSHSRSQLRQFNRLCTQLQSTCSAAQHAYWSYSALGASHTAGSGCGLPALSAMVLRGTLRAVWRICTPTVWSKLSSLSLTASRDLLAYSSATPPPAVQQAPHQA